MATNHKQSHSNLLIQPTDLDPETFREFGQVIQNPASHNGNPKWDHFEANQGTATKWLNVSALRSSYELASSQKPAEPIMTMFVCRPRPLSDGKFQVKVLERHPFTPQTFIPIGLDKHDTTTSYLVIVAPTLPVASIMTSEEKARRNPPYPVPPPRRRKSLKERLLGARPNPFTNDYAPSTTPITSTSSQTPKGAGPPDLDNIKAFVARGDQAVTYGPGTWHAPMVVLGKRPVEFVVVQYANGVALEDCQEITIEAPPGQTGIEVVSEGHIRSRL